MVKKIVALMAAGAFAASLSTVAVAQKDKHKTAKHNPTCPVCKMEFSSTKDDKNPVAVKAGKKTVYCCSGCDMKDWKKDKKGTLLLPKEKK